MKIKQFLIAACIGTMFTACSSKDDFTHEDDNIIRLRAEVTPISYSTRAVEDGTLPNTTISTTECIGVRYFKSSDGSSIDSDLCTVNANGTINTGTDVEWPDESIFIHAVTPSTYSTPGTASSDLTYDVKLDQTTKANYIASDVMIAQEMDLTKSGGPVTLHFKHMMSKVIVKLQSSLSNIDVTTATDIILNMGKQFYIKRDASNNITVMGNYSAPSAIKMGDYSANGVAAIVPPQNFDNGYSITFNIGGVTYTFTPNSTTSRTLESGHAYTYTLSVDQSTVKVKNFEVTAWEGETQSGTATW